MPRIDPHQLLKCLSVLLSPTGGIKSKDEVQRLANLMTKFSKKLVSKCIYVSILKATDIVLLNMFMSSGGWDLTFSWLSDGVSAKNWPLVRELIELLLVCPVDIDRLKTNSCPKLIKTLSKDLTAEEYVRVLACQLVEQWLRIVRGDDVPILPSRIEEPLQPQEASSQPEDSNKPEDDSSLEKSQSLEINEADATDGHLPVYKITIKDGKKVLTEVNNKGADDDSGTETSAMEETEPPSEEIEDDDDDEDYVIKPVRLKKKPAAAAKGKRAAKVVNKKERISTDSGGSTGKTSKDSGKPPAKRAKVTDQAKSKAEDKVKGKAVDQVKGKATKHKLEQPKVKEASSKKVKEIEEATSAKNKDTGKLNLSLKNRKRLVTEKEHGKFDKLHAKDKLKERPSIMDMDTLTDKEKETLSKFITPPISKLGKIPKKSSVSKEEKPLDDKNKPSKESNDAKHEVKKQPELKKEENSKNDPKKLTRSPIPEIKKEKEKKWSIEPKRALPSDQKPKTAKIFSAKFRSTGLEEEITKPPSRKDVKDHPKKEKPPLLPSLNDKKPLKRSSPPPPETHIPEKKVKPESPIEEKKQSEKPGIKLIPPKPRPMFLQESDVFMDAMLAANTLKEPRKRKRKGSLSKDHPEPKKDGSSPNHSGSAEDPNSSPSAVKPTFKFYQDTMDTSMEEDKADDKMEDENLEFAEPSADEGEGGDDQKSMSSEEDKSTVPRRDSGGMKGVLVHLKSRKQKKSVSWKEEGLEAIRYFELDENERVNVTKNFTDMKNQEKELEREHFLIARKLAVDDVMEERTRWVALIPIDMSAAAAVVAAGKNSQEKEIQYAREKTIPAAIYFNRRMIPDTPAEPDLEIHATTDPASIPLEDITGSIESTHDFTTVPWPEPKGAPPPPTVPVPVPPPGPFPPQGGPGPGPFPPMPGPGPFMPGPPGPGMPMPPGGEWRPGDGSMIDMPPGPPGMFPGPPGMMPPGMPMPMMGMPMPLMSIPVGNPEDMPPGPPFHPGPFPIMGPPGPGPFPGPPGPGPQGNWQGPPPNGPNWDQQGPPPSGGDRGGRYQGGGSWRGGRGSGGNRNTDNWRGNSRREVPLCNKGQFCRNNNCRFRHPR